MGSAKSVDEGGSRGGVSVKRQIHLAVSPKRSILESKDVKRRGGEGSARRGIFGMARSYPMPTATLSAGRALILGNAVPLEVTQKRSRGDSLLIE
ncbi:hypothetical protein ACSS6W_000747 [Trichoderma asperelloides]